MRGGRGCPAKLTAFQSNPELVVKQRHGGNVPNRPVGTDEVIPIVSLGLTGLETNAPLPLSESSHQQPK